jgi:23S rRNA pseudouridine1911/1915/1917 synthase
LKKAIKKELVRVNDAIATSGTILNGGERLSLSPPAEARPKKKLIFPLKVLYEDDHLAVVHKPAGILVSGNRFKTIANALPQNIQTSTLPDAVSPQPVHRLDYATTGALLIGKTNSAIRALNGMFEDKRVEKTYYAVTIGEMNMYGTIRTEVEGKKSRTTYTVLDSVFSKRFGHLTLVLLSPHTGRRHQLRKHLSGINNPILGDKEYGAEGLILKGKGLYLHAHSLSFIHPFTKEHLLIRDEFLERFKKIFNFSTTENTTDNS